MESNLMKLSIFLEELKLRKAQVIQLDSELGRLSLKLIERESEYHAKTTHCQQLELKLAKIKQDMKQVVDDSTNRMKTTQGEINRLEAAILDNAEKLRKSQTEKQCLQLKNAHFEKEIKEIYEHVLTVIDSLPKINQHQENLSKFFLQMEAKQVKLAETCEMVQIHVARILKEAEEKWKTAQELRVNRAQLEKMLITAQTQLRLIDGNLGNNEDTATSFRKQNESTLNQLEMSRKREEKLRLDLQREREARLDLELKHEQVLNQLAYYLSSEQKEPLSKTVSE